MVVWIAKGFTEQHRAALDWLNEVSEAGTRFFGLEIELWQIGESPPAPKFNVVAKLNDWTKEPNRTDGPDGHAPDATRLLEGIRGVCGPQGQDRDQDQLAQAAELVGTQRSRPGRILPVRSGLHAVRGRPVTN